MSRNLGSLGSAGGISDAAGLTAAGADVFPGAAAAIGIAVLLDGAGVTGADAAGGAAFDARSRSATRCARSSRLLSSAILHRPG